MNEEEYYNNQAFWGEETYLKNKTELNRFQIVSSLIPKETKTLLDVGCGNGAFIKYLENNNLAIKSLGYERSEVAIAHKLCKSGIIKGSVNQIDFKENSFDTVVALEVIEHLPYQIFENSIKEIQRIAKNHIIISVPFKEKSRLIKCPYCGCMFSPYFHIRDFNDIKMKNLFDDFTLIHKTYINKYRKYFLWDKLKDLWFIKLKKEIPELPNHSSCPQCAFRPNNNNLDERKETVNGGKKIFKQGLKLLTPYTISYTWIACVYKRNNLNS